MVHDIVRGTFKGFALLRQATGHSSRGTHQLSTKPVYAPGYGLIPPSQLYGGEAAATVLHPPGSGMVGPHTGAAPGTAYPQLLSPGPLTAAHPQFVLGVQHMQMAGTALHTPVYNVIGNPGFSGPVYLSPIDYGGGAAAAQGAQLGVGGVGASGDMMLYSDRSSLLQGSTGNRLFQAVGGMHRGSAAAGGLLGNAADGGMHHLGGAMAYGSAAGGASHGHGVPGAAGPSSGGLLQPGSLVVDAEGSLYTYTVDG